MNKTFKRSTVYFEPELHRAIQLKAVHTHRSVSEIVNDAVRESLREDYEDTAAFEERASETVVAYKVLIKSLRKHRGL